jgi:hypothetical protein
MDEELIVKVSGSAIRADAGVLEDVNTKPKVRQSLHRPGTPENPSARNWLFSSTPLIK